MQGITRLLDDGLQGRKSGITGGGNGGVYRGVEMNPVLLWLFYFGSLALVGHFPA